LALCISISLMHHWSEFCQKKLLNKMFFSLPRLLQLIETYRYALLFPIAVFEGPIATIIAGFLISLGYLNGLLAYPLILVADTIGDGLHYYVGILLRHNKANRILKILRITPERLANIEKHFILHPKKSILIAKVLHGVGGIVQIVAGLARMPFFEFLWVSFVGTLPKSLILLLVGYFFGKYIAQIDNYLSIGGGVLFGLTIASIGSYMYLSKYIEKKSHIE
jgi:membrane-associated protein